MRTLHCVGRFGGLAQLFAYVDLVVGIEHLAACHPAKLIQRPERSGEGVKGLQGAPAVCACCATGAYNSKNAAF
jgi:hypothetical protein